MWLIILIPAAFVFLVLLISCLIGVPCLSTHKKQAELMIELGEIKPGMKVVDLGSGMGRLLFLAADKGADAWGYELNPILVIWTMLKTRFKKTSGQVVVRWQSLFNADVKDADVVYCFLFENFMAKLENKLFSELKPGAKIIVYTFPFKNRQAIKKIQGISVYQV